MFKFAALLFVLFCLFIISLGFFDRSSYGEAVKLSVLAPLTIFFILFFLRETKKKNLNISDRLLFGLLAITASKAIFLYLSRGDLLHFPLDIFVLILLSVIHPFSEVIIYAVVITALNITHSYLGGDRIPIASGIYDTVFLLFSLTVIKTLFVAEQKAKEDAEGQLEGIESLAARISTESGKGGGGSRIAISEETKEEFFLDSAYRLRNSIKETLGTIREMTDSYSCSLYTSSLNSMTIEQERSSIER